MPYPALFHAGLFNITGTGLCKILIQSYTDLPKVDTLHKSKITFISITTDHIWKICKYWGVTN